MKPRRYQFMGEPPSERPLLLDCDSHGKNAVGWISCIHVDAIQSGRRHPKPIEGVAGEAVCPSCRLQLDRRRIPVMSLRFICEGCVLARWPLEGAS